MALSEYMHEISRIRTNNTSIYMIPNIARTDIENLSEVKSIHRTANALKLSYQKKSEDEEKVDFFANIQYISQ